MFEMKCRIYTEAEQKELAVLFAQALAKDPAFAAAFPSPEAQQAHAGQFVRAYARQGEIHTFLENGVFQAAALWSLPGQRVPSPIWDFGYREPCCKLYLLASRKPGAGSALLRFAQFRYKNTPLTLLCSQDWQKSYFARFGFRETGHTGFGTILHHDGSAPEKTCGRACI